MLLHSITDNILISHPSYSGVYQYEAKMRSLQRDKFVFELEQNLSPSTFGFFLID